VKSCKADEQEANDLRLKKTQARQSLSMCKRGGEREERGEYVRALYFSVTSS